MLGGIVFSTNFPEPVQKIHKMKSKLDFRTEKRARDHAIALCKIWIDRQREKTKSSPVDSCSATRASSGVKFIRTVAIRKVKTVHANTHATACKVNCSFFVGMIGCFLTTVPIGELNPLRRKF